MQVGKMENGDVVLVLEGKHEVVGLLQHIRTAAERYMDDSPPQDSAHKFLDHLEGEINVE